MDFDKPDNLESSRSEWEEDISLEQALKEVNAAKARVDMKRRMADFSKALDWRRQEDRWRAMYDFLYKYNPSAARALDDFNRDCDARKQEQKSWKATSAHMQYGLHMPRILWDALTIVDPEMQNFDSLDSEQKKKIYRKLGRAFPRYWMPRV
jgi:hypothetical protein